MNLIDGLDEADRARLNDWERHMLRDPNEADEIRQRAELRRPHCDKELLKSPKVYGDFLNRLADAGMVRFERAERREGVLGVFFVHKKSGQQRIIFDTRILNSQFVDPPRAQLPLAAALSVVEIGPGEQLYIASGDISNAFYGMAIPESLGSRLTLPTARAAHVSRKHLSSLDVSDVEAVIPCLTVLLMGWSWSLHLCQRVVSHCMAQTLEPGAMIVDKSPGLLLAGQGSQRDRPTGDSRQPSCFKAAGAVYVDNFAVLSTCQKYADQKILEAKGAMIKLGLVAHEMEPAATTAEFVGLGLRNGVWSVRPKRMWRLRRALQAVLARGFISGRALEVLVGHITWSALVKREGLAILDNVYTHIQAHYDTHGPLSSAVHTELFQIMSVLPLLRLHTCAAWHDRLTMSDASPFGIGVVDRQVEAEAIGAIGRCVEKWRFHAESTVAARRSALGTSPGTSNHVVIKEHAPQLHSAVGSFTEVPPDLLQVSKVNEHAACCAYSPD